MKFLISAVFSVVLLSACADIPVNISSKEYAANCRQAERRKNFTLAEQECDMALKKSDWGDNPKIKSQHLYNSGRIKLHLAKFSEAEFLLNVSLQIEEMLTSPSKTVGLRLIDLSDSLAGQNKWLEGAPYLARVLPIAPQYSKQERARIGALLLLYSRQLITLKQNALAKRFKNTAKIIVDNDTYSFRN